jgi:S1-C subfamily serine protease
MPIMVGPDSVIKLELSANETDPSIKVDGAPYARGLGKWIEICTRQTDAVVRLKLTEVTFATATFVSADKKAAAPPPDVVTVAPPKPAPRAPSARSAPAEERALDRAKQCVFQLRLKDKSGQVFGNGTGFLVAPGGYGVTNYHVVSGASSAVAVFAGDKTEYAVELWSKHKGSDLAIVQIKAGRESAFDSRGLLEAGRPPVEGQEVWALGFPLGLGYSVTRGVVNGIREPAEIPEEARKEFPDVKSWVQTDCTINSGNSGGPLIDESGMLIGINTWVFTVGQSVFFAINATELRTVFDSAMKQKRPIGFASVASDDVKHRGIGAITSKLPRVEIKQTGTAEQVRTAAAALSATVVRKCNSCGGDGEINIKVTVGRTRAGRPIQQEGVRMCKACDGEGMLDPAPAAATKAASRLCSAVVNLKQNDPKGSAALNDAYTAISQKLGNSLEAAKALNDEAMGRAAQRNIKPQEPLVLAGEYMGLAKDGKDHIHFLQLIGTNQFVAASSTRLSDQMESGVVLVGGAMAGEVTLPDGTRMLVLQGGFVVKAAGLRIRTRGVPPPAQAPPGQPPRPSGYPPKPPY